MIVKLNVQLGDNVAAVICVEDHMSFVDRTMKKAEYHEIPFKSAVYARLIGPDLLARLENPKGVWIYADDK